MEKLSISIKAALRVSLVLTLFLGGCATLEQRTEDAPKKAPVTLTNQQRLDIAREAYASGDVDKAINQYQKIIANDNLHRKANYNITIIHLEMALKGMEFVRQFVDDETDAKAARDALDSTVKHAGLFTGIVSRYMVQ